MDTKKQTIQSFGIKLTIEKGGKQAGRASLFLITNQLHDKPYGLLEDVFVEEEYRGQGLGAQLVNMVIEEAKGQKCTKLIGQSRYGREKVHSLYKSLGFKDHGKNFRMDFE